MLINLWQVFCRRIKNGDMMKITCPKCIKKLDISPEMLIGNYVICYFCKHLFKWAGNAQVNNNSIKSDKT